MTDNPQVTIRLDSAPATTQIWSRSTDYQSAGLWSNEQAIPFLRSLKNGMKLAIRVEEHERRNAVFNLANVEDVTSAIAIACNWPTQKASPGTSSPIVTAERSPPDGNTPDLGSLAKEIVGKVIAAHSGSPQEAISSVKANYANSIAYYGKQWSLFEVLADKASYFERWPTRVYKVLSDSVSASCSQTKICEVRGVLEYQTIGKKSASGRATFTYTLDMNAEPRIVGEDGKVLR